MAIIYKLNVLHVQRLYSVYLDSINTARLPIISEGYLQEPSEVPVLCGVSYFSFHVGFNWIRLQHTLLLAGEGKIKY